MIQPKHMEESMIDSNPKAVDFLGYEIALIEDEDGKTYVPLKRLCEILGISQSKHSKMIKDDNLCHWKIIPVPGANGKKTKVFCLPFDQFCRWIIRIAPHSVRPEISEEFFDYQTKMREEQYWRERSEEGRDLPKVPDNAYCLITQFSGEIQESLRQIRDTIHDYEEYAIYKEVYATKSPIMLSILAGLSKDLAKLSKEIADGFHLMLDVNDYWRWSCCNSPEAAEELRKEMESLANQGQ